MASILRVDTLTDASSNNSTAMSTINQGTAKAWGNTSGVGTPALADSFNMGSVTDLGTGGERFTFSSAMANANFSTQAFLDHNSSIVTIQQIPDYGQSTTTTSVQSHTTSAAVDADVHTTVHGDLA